MKRLIIVCITIVAVCVTVIIFSMRNDWKVMKTGSSICRINARTGETFVLTNRDGMEWVRVEKKRKEITSEELDALPVVK